MPVTSAAERRFLRSSDLWLRNCQSTGIAPKTLTDYSHIITSFYEFFVSSDLFRDDPTFTTIQAYRDALLDRGCAVRTVHQHLVVLRAFFTFASSPDLGGEQFYLSNPVSLMLFPAMRKIDARPYDLLLTDEQVMHLWRNTPVVTTHPENWPRNYAIVVLLLSTELRNSELRTLTLADLDFQSEQITVDHGKGDKFRTVDFPLIAQTAVRAYLASGIRPQDVPASAPLFGTMRSGVWKAGTQQWLSGVVERHVFAVTGVHNIRSHDLRHVGARIDLNSGMDHYALQAKLGHANPQTTQIYSGKLMARAGRGSARRVIAERDYQAQRNLDRLAAAN